MKENFGVTIYVCILMKIGLNKFNKAYDKPSEILNYYILFTKEFATEKTELAKD
jgi:hypothetical protein